jgi:hypothetical protein
VESETNGVPVLIVFIWPFSIFIQNLNEYVSNVSYTLDWTSLFESRSWCDDHVTVMTMHLFCIY